MKVISLGLGVQSTALYYMSSLGEFPRVDAAIFIDLGREKTKTYEYLKFLLQWADKHNGIPISVVKKKNLFTDLLARHNSSQNRFASIPAYTINEDGVTGMLRRQCTGEYKIAQVDQEIRALCGIPARKRNHAAEVWKGISLEEVERLSIPQEKWKTQVYPFCGYQTTRKDTVRLEWGRLMTRNDILNWYEAHGLPVPPKSSCVFCPYTSEFAWKNLKENHPEDFADAVRVDHAIRDSSKQGVDNPIFLHESCIPLDEVQFQDNQEDLWKGECSGECHN